MAKGGSYMALIIGFGHKARQGKDTVCQIVHEALPKLTRIVSFADDLKAHARVMGMRTKDSGMLQLLGSALRRVDPAVFVRCLASRLEDVGAPCVLVSDVRYINEADWIRQRNGMVVRVTRHEPNGLLYVAPDRDPDHLSETELDTYHDWNWYISALSGDIQKLEEEAAILVKVIAGRLGGTAPPYSILEQAWP